MVREAIQNCGMRWCATLLALAALSSAIAAEPPGTDLGDLSLDQLGNIQISSVSKHDERLADAPASIFVITADDIRRSGATSLPEALRLAPNLEVARVGSSAYSISARGFNNSIGNKLLVLLDGRILYTPLYSGVFWDVQDVMLEDVDRIEVISGPGATLWGSNAVNGVINVITRRASETQGGLASVSAGNLERNYALRYGSTDADASYRVYGKFFDRDATSLAGGASQKDSWDRGEGGFRADWGTPASGFTLEGAAYRGTEFTGPPEDERFSGADLLGRWNHQLASGGAVQLQSYFDQTYREIPGSITDRLHIYDIEFQHDVAPIDGHTLTWGLSQRGAFDNVTNTPGPSIAFLPAKLDLNWTSIFAQDEIALRGDALKLIPGLRLENNTFTGTEVLPTIRLAWKLSPSQFAWLALTRAVRTPSILDRDLYSPSQPPFLIAGGPDFRSEVADVLELGYRAQPSPMFSYSVAVYHNAYDYLRSFEFTPAGNFVIGNKMEGNSNGFEAWGVVTVTKSWRLSAGASFLDMNLRLKADSTDPIGVSAAGDDPGLQWSLRSSLDVSRNIEFDATLRRVGSLPDPVVPAYTAVDVHLGWRPTDRLELSVTGTNIFDRRHIEFGDVLTASEIDRAFQTRIVWKF
jgi:iron complex outermembrane receptor protein